MLQVLPRKDYILVSKNMHQVFRAQFFASAHAVPVSVANSSEAGLVKSLNLLFFICYSFNGREHKNFQYKMCAVPSLDPKLSNLVL